MGYRGKVDEQNKARDMRASGMTLQDIADELGVAKSSVSLWVRDVPFTPSKRRYGPRLRPNKLMQRKLDEIDAGLAFGIDRLQDITEVAFLAAGAALYAAPARRCTPARVASGMVRSYSQTAIREWCCSF